MKLHTLGHACMLLEDGAGRPVLASDPWLEGSCYWRSWWLLNPPREDQVAAVAQAPFLYITHEHPDHLHLPSLRKLGAAGKTVLLPDFHRMKMDAHLRDMGFAVRVLPTGQWVPLQDGISVMALPQWNNDSVLVVDTPKALVVNLNDAKPLGGLFDDIAALKARLGKPLVMLRSHSPAGPFFNYFRDGARTPNLTKGSYVSKVNQVCDQFGADLFIPFASQVVLRRSDSQWANDYKVGHDDLRAGWQSKTTLCPPFSSVDLGTLAVDSEPQEAWRGAFTEARQARVAAEEARNAAETLTGEDITRLRATLARQRALIAVLLPKGVAVRCAGRRFLYTPLSGRLTERPDGGACTIDVPVAALKDALAFGHFGDLCITMFVPITLHGGTPAAKVDMFWMLMILADYGYAGGPLGRLKWLWWSWTVERRRTLPLPPAPSRPQPLPEPLPVRS
ncbi:MBL fold metallo-hydrolase [Novispirillum sp. DQ9]|uniref:MBL fold metallo-hydrolase n=1 Tax=Novispirillum sp. DQ9 TaxID=3398612 RepID=UPI003C7C4669